MTTQTNSMAQQCATFRRCNTFRPGRSGMDGFKRVYYTPADERLVILADAEGMYWVGITDPLPQGAGWPFEHMGPYDSGDGAWARLREVFIDRPSGATAELLCHYRCQPVVRQLLRSMNGGDHTARLLLEDWMEENGMGHLTSAVVCQLSDLGVSPGR